MYQLGSPSHISTHEGALTLKKVGDPWSRGTTLRVPSFKKAPKVTSLPYVLLSNSLFLIHGPQVLSVCFRRPLYSLSPHLNVCKTQPCASKYHRFEFKTPPVASELIIAIHLSLHSWIQTDGYQVLYSTSCCTQPPHTQTPSLSFGLLSHLLLIVSCQSGPLWIVVVNVALIIPLTGAVSGGGGAGGRQPGVQGGGPGPATDPLFIVPRGFVASTDTRPARIKQDQ